MIPIFFKYNGITPLPQLLYDNVTNVGKSRVDDTTIYQLNYSENIKHTYNYFKSHGDIRYMRLIKLDKLLNKTLNLDYNQQEIEIINLFDDNSINIVSYY